MKKIGDLAGNHELSWALVIRKHESPTIWDVLSKHPQDYTVVA